MYYVSLNEADSPRLLLFCAIHLSSYCKQCVCVWGGGGEEVILIDVEGQTEMPEQVQFHVLSACSFTLLSKVVTFCQEVQSNIAFLA